MPTLNAFCIDIAVEDLDFFCEFLRKDFKKRVSVKEIFGSEFVIKTGANKKIKNEDARTYNEGDNDDGDKYNCILCDKVYDLKKRLTQHIKRKHSIDHKLLKCERCEYTTTTELRLSNHMLFKHVDKISKQKPCEICGKILAHKKALTKHIKEVHTKTDLHHCDSCSYSTKRSYDLTRHMSEKHSGKSAPSFACYVCGHCTKYKQALEDHIDKNHNNIDYPCDRCDFIAKSKRQLSDHKRDHLGIPPCPICSKQLSTRKQADQHYRRVHLKEEKVTLHCDLCSFSTASKKILQRHSFKTHGTGEPPEVKKTGKIYPCPFPGCDKQLDNRPGKNSHIIKVHKMKVSEVPQLM